MYTNACIEAGKIGLELAPVSGNAISAYEMTTGKNIWNGESISPEMRSLTIIGMAVPEVKGVKYVGRAEDSIKELNKITEIVKGFNHDGTYHGLNRIIERGVTPTMIKETVLKPLQKVNQLKGRIKYLSEKATIVIDKAGQVVTAYTKEQYTEKTKAIINSLLNKK